MYYIQICTAYKVSTISKMICVQENGYISKWDIVLIFIYFATIQLINIIDTRECWNMVEDNKNQSVEIEFWDIESDDMPELEESDISGVYFNEFREYVDEEGNLLSPSEVDAIRYKDDYEDDYYR